MVNQHKFIILHHGRSKPRPPLSQYLFLQAKVFLRTVTPLSPYSFALVTSIRSRCDSIYEIGSSLSKKGASIGNGPKILPLSSKEKVPGVGRYSIEDGINPEKQR